MTCIVGVKDKGKVWIGGDSAGGNQFVIENRIHPKVFRNGLYLIGYTTSFRMGQLLEVATLPIPEPDEDLYRFMITKFVNVIRSTFEGSGWAGKDEEGKASGGNFLVGVNGHLFDIQADFQVGENQAGYAACGSGGDVALGSLHSTQGKHPRVRIEKALEAAQAHTPFVRGPFTITQW
jgi:ATP-dependent protease HslVU (ClpYQ) peptidase subunit